MNRNAIIEVFKRNELLRFFVSNGGNNRAKYFVEAIKPYLDKRQIILDIGSGTCNICNLLRIEGYHVIPLDIYNYSFVDGLSPVIYDGYNMPFKNEQFDIALLITVLHCAKDPLGLLKEAVRLANRIVVVEDIFLYGIHKLAVETLDSLLNLEFLSHPRKYKFYKSQEEWEVLFEKLGLNVVDKFFRNQYFAFKHVFYYLKKHREMY